MERASKIVIVRRPDPLWDSSDLLSLALYDIFLSAGMACEIISFVDYDRHSKDADVWIFMATAKTFHRFIRTDPPKGLKVYFNHERLPHMSSESNGYGVRMRSLDITSIAMRFYRRKWRRIRQLVLDRGFIDMVFDFNPHDCDFWHKNGVKAFFVPVGWHQRFVFDEVENRQNDAVTFLGRFDASAKHRLHSRDLLKESGIEIVCPRKPRDRSVVAKYLVSLNLQHYVGYSGFPDRRMSILAANRCTVVSDFCDWVPFEDDLWIECDDIVKGCRGAFSRSDIGDDLERFYRTRFAFRDCVLNAMANI